MNKLLPLLAVVALLPASASAQTLYGVVSSTYGDDNAYIATVDLDNLSTDPANPTVVTETVVLEHATDFMAGTSAADAYYAFYNIYNNETGSARQYFCTVDFTTGETTTIADCDPSSDDATDFMDLVYDPLDGGLLALDRQYITSTQTYISTMQLVNTARGRLTEVYVFDNKYSAICSDGESGYYLATIDRTGAVDADNNRIYAANIYHANAFFRVNGTPILSEDIPAQSSFAHSMTMHEGKLYLASGSILDVIDPVAASAETYYLDRELFGITFYPGGTSSVANVVAASDATITMRGNVAVFGAPTAVAVYTADGRKVASDAQATSFDLSHLPAGLYIVATPAARLKHLVR